MNIEREQSKILWERLFTFLKRHCAKCGRIYYCNYSCRDEHRKEDSKYCFCPKCYHSEFWYMRERARKNCFVYQKFLQRKKRD